MGARAGHLGLPAGDPESDLRPAPAAPRKWARGVAGCPSLAWTNIVDAGDVVALVKDLRPAFGNQLAGYVVHNGAHAHDARAYLTDPVPVPRSRRDSDDNLRGGAQGRRLLVATAVAHYSKAPQWDRPASATARQQVIDLFTDTLGYTHLSDLGLDPTETQLTEHLRTVCKNQVRPEDHLVIYIAGHGEVLDEAGGRHVLLTADTDPDDIADALPTLRLADKMLLDTPVQRLLLLLDTCYSGTGGNQVAAAVLAGMQREWRASRSGLVVVTPPSRSSRPTLGPSPPCSPQPCMRCPPRDRSRHPRPRRCRAGHERPPGPARSPADRLDRSRPDRQPAGLPAQPTSPARDDRHRPAPAAGHRMGDPRRAPRDRVPTAVPCPRHGRPRTGGSLVVQRPARVP